MSRTVIFEKKIKAFKCILYYKKYGTLKVQSIWTKKKSKHFLKMKSNGLQKAETESTVSHETLVSYIQFQSVQSLEIL